MKQGRRKRAKAAAEAETMGIPPWFKPDYMEAFFCFMLHRLGGSQSIAVENLDKFPEDAKVVWDYDEDLKTITASYTDGKGDDGEPKIILPTGAEQLAISSKKVEAA